MAKKIIEQYISDLSGVDLPKDANPVRFAFDGRLYEIDLTESERAEFADVMAPYVAAARPTGSGRSRSTRSSDGPDPKEVRAWARENGYDVPDRGRIPSSILEAYASLR